MFQARRKEGVGGVGRERILSHHSINLDLKPIIYPTPDIKRPHTHFKIFLGDGPNINFIVEYYFILISYLAKIFRPLLHIYLIFSLQCLTEEAKAVTSQFFQMSKLRQSEIQVFGGLFYSRTMFRNWMFWYYCWTLPFPNNQWANKHKNFPRYKVTRAHMKGTQWVSRFVSEWDITRNRRQLCSGEPKVQSQKVGRLWAIEGPRGWGPWQRNKEQRLFKH